MPPVFGKVGQLDDEILFLAIDSALASKGGRALTDQLFTSLHKPIIPESGRRLPISNLESLRADVVGIVPARQHGVIARFPMPGQDVQGPTKEGDHLDEIDRVFPIDVVGRDVARQARVVAQRVVTKEPKDGSTGGETVEVSGDDGSSSASSLVVIRANNSAR
jgi:hypothetical protein